MSGGERANTGRGLIRCCGTAVVLAALTAPGCTWVTRYGSITDGAEFGKTFFVGGAGSIGAVAGTFETPRALRAAGYSGAVEVFGWQSYIGDALRDQVDEQRNRGEAGRLAAQIAAYLREHPGAEVNIVALSAGTGISAWAVEQLPPGQRIGTIVLLSSSMSREYDLTAVLRRSSHVYAFYSPSDPVLGVLVRGVGTVDRGAWTADAAGLSGFALPAGARGDTRLLYAERLRNVPYRPEWSRLGYWGMHADSVAERFVERVVARLLLGEPVDDPSLAPAPEPAMPASEPAMPASDF